MKKYKNIGFVFASLFALASCAQPEEVKSEALDVNDKCVTNVAEMAAANNDTLDALAFCTCLKTAIMEQPTLATEIEAAGGLPTPDATSPEFGAVFDRCKEAAK